MGANTVIGGLSLAIQLAGSCLRGYEIITSTLEASEDSYCLSLQFEIEQSRLRDFIEAAELADRASDDGANQALFTKTAVLLNVLDGIKLTLARYANNEECQDGPLGEVTSPTISTNLSEGYGSLSSNLSMALRKASEPMGKVRSFTWSVFRKSDSEKVLTRLGRYNDFLHELLDTQQLCKLRDQQQQKYMELVQMRNSLDDIRRLTEAAHASKIVHSRASTWQHAMDEELENLARFKTLYTSLLKRSSSHVGDIRIASSKVILESKATELDHPRAVRKLDDGNEKEVWINWQSQDIPNKDSTSTSISSIEELTILLMAPKPDEFSIPTCIGYSILQYDEEEARPALIFENPAGIDPKVQPISLFHALEQYTKPSLTHRIALAHKVAQCLLYLHAVNWLHKALRSSNIIFFPTFDSELEIRSPYITGFDNSRRSRFNEETNEVPRIGRMEVYRHPDTQIDGLGLSYRKTFDIYSLGLVLIEIALWKPIVSIMGIEEVVDQSSKATRSIQERWLVSEPGLLNSLRAEVGEKYAGAVETCLKGRDAFGIERKNVETSPDTGMVIQRGFNANVVRPLAEIAV